MARNHRTLWNDDICTLCGSDQLLDFLEIEGIPAQDGITWPSRAQAIDAPRGDISLSLCRRCGYVGNRLFEPELLSFVDYNVSLEHSPRYQRFIQRLAARLIEQYDVRNKTILDIGCGDGFFLKTICVLGSNQGVGFDPSYADIGPPESGAEGIQFIKDYYTERYSNHAGDLVCCRQVIDHLGNPKGFLEMIRRLIGEKTDTVVYCEVPNAAHRLQQFVPWNVGYEHGSWFFQESFRLLFQSCGFEVKNTAPCHDDNYLGLEAIPVAHSLREVPPSERPDIDRLAADLGTLSSRFEMTVSNWKQRLEQIEQDGIRAVPWGAGELGIGYLNILDIRQLMPFIVDINPARVGRFLPGTGQEVVSPGFLTEYQPDLIIITNPTYSTEIQEQAAELGITCDYAVV